MAMPYLIDGHNLIPNIPGLSLSALDDEQQLIELLQDYCRVEQKQVEVYFDQAPPGHPARQKYGAVTAHYVRQGSSADSAIRSRLNRLGKTAGNWIVVSSDHQVQNAAHAARARVASSQEFARQVMAALNRAAKNGNRPNRDELAPGEVDEWLDIFSKRGDSAK
jgi:predicted RNA-binding protein with PIN domain